MRVTKVNCLSCSKPFVPPSKLEQSLKKSSPSLCRDCNKRLTERDNSGFSPAKNRQLRKQLKESQE